MKYLKTVFFTVLLSIFVMAGGSLLGQESNRLEDVIYLKDGSIIRGTVTEIIMGEHVKVEILGGSVLVYQESEIEMITKERPLYKKIVLRPFKEDLPIYIREQGVFQAFSWGFGLYRDAWDEAILTTTFNYRAGYKWNRYAALALGVGFDPYNEGVIMPFFLEYHADLSRSVVAPYVFGQLGYGWGAIRNWPATSFDGGVYSQLGIGIKRHTRHKAEWMLTLSYKAQQSRVVYSDDIWWGPNPGSRIEETRIYNRIFLTASIGWH